MYCMCATKKCHFCSMVTAAESNAQKPTDNAASPEGEGSRITLLIADLCVASIRTAYSAVLPRKGLASVMLL